MTQALAQPAQRDGLTDGEVADLLSVAVAVVAGSASGSAGVDVLRRRAADGCAVARVRTNGGGTVILKLWTKSGLRGAVRRVTGTLPAVREWRALKRLNRFGASVPQALGYRRLGHGSGPYTEALLLEDLGPVEEAMEYIKRPIAAGDAAGLRKFEDGLVELTRVMLAAGVVDTDHGMVNTVVPASGMPVRLDFELAMRVPFPTLVPRAYGEMIGRLVGTYAFAMQPDVTRTLAFAGRLVDELRIPRRVLSHAKVTVDALMEKQKREIGLDTRVPLDW